MAVYGGQVLLCGASSISRTGGVQRVVAGIHQLRHFRVSALLWPAPRALLWGALAGDVVSVCLSARCGPAPCFSRGRVRESSLVDTVVVASVVSQILPILADFFGSTYMLRSRTIFCKEMGSNVVQLY